MKKIDPEIKQMIYDLVESGMSMSEVALKLDIGKTTVHTNYNKMKVLLNQRSENEGSDYHNNRSDNDEDDIGTTNYTNDFTPVVYIGDKETEPKAIIAGPLSELMEFIPYDFKGLVVSNSQLHLSNFAWYFAKYLNLLNHKIEILTDVPSNYETHKLSSMLSNEIILPIRGCNRITHVKNIIEKGDSQFYFIDNLTNLKISEEELQQLNDLFPDVSIVALTLDENYDDNFFDFIAKLNLKDRNEVNIETKYGFINQFYDFGQFSYFSLK